MQDQNAKKKKQKSTKLSPPKLTFLICDTTLSTEFGILKRKKYTFCLCNDKKYGCFTFENTFI